MVKYVFIVISAINTVHRDNNRRSSRTTAFLQDHCISPGPWDNERTKTVTSQDYTSANRSKHPEKNSKKNTRATNQDKTFSESLARVQFELIRYSIRQSWTST